MHLKNVKRGRINEYSDKFGAEFMEGKRPWGIKCDVALPCATQNEINEAEAKELVNNGCFVVAEGANMPSDAEAVNVSYPIRYSSVLVKQQMRWGGVSGLEMSGILASFVDQKRLTID